MICYHEFQVQDERGVGVEYAHVRAVKSVQTGFYDVSSDTTNVGRAVLALDEGDTYTATATKEGYVCLQCKKTFIPSGIETDGDRICKGKIILSLKKGEEMTAKACIKSHDPGENKVIEVGTTVNVKNIVENCGDAEEYCYTVVGSDTLGDVASFKYEWLRTWWDTVKTEGSFIMPNHNVVLYFYGGHWDGAKWIQDVKKTITLTAQVVKEDTKLKCYDKTTEVGKKVTLEAKLEEKAWPYYDIKNGYIKFYVGGAYVGGAWSDADGKAYVDYTPASVGEYAIKAVFSAAGNYNGSQGTCTLTVEAPPKKDTKLKCYNKSVEVNKKVTLEAKLEVATFPYVDIKNGYVKFYMNGAYQGGDYTDDNGKAYLDITPTASGTYTIKAVFSAAGDYNGSEGTCTLTVTPPLKKDTKIKCYDKTIEVNKTVTLEAKLEEAALPYYDIKDGLVMFYVAGIYVGYDHTDADGKAYTNYTPSSVGTFTIKVVFSAAGVYNGSEGTCTLTVKAPLKEDTKLKCYDKTTEVDKKVTLEAKLEEKAFPYNDIKNGYVKFYVGGAYVGGAWSDADGKAYVDYTPTSVGTYTIKAVFEAAGDYNGSEGTCTLTVKGKPKGAIISYTPPTELEEGKELRAPTTIKNIGEAKGEFRMFLFDDATGEEIEHEPKLTWKDLDPAGTYTETLDTDFWVGAMPDHDWKLRIEVRKQTTPDVADDTKRFTVKLKAVKKDTKIKCYDKTIEVNKKVTLEAKLEEKAFPYNDIKNGNIKFYVGGASVGSGLTDADGKAYVDYTPTSAGTFTIKAVFEAAGDYNGSEGTCTLTVEAPPKEDTKIVGFSIRDEAEKDVTTLTLGKKYTLRAYLKTKEILSKPIPSATLYFRKGDGREIGHNTTNEVGYAGIFWVPESADIGVYNIKTEFDGTEVFNRSSSSLIRLTVEKELETHNFNVVYGVKWCGWGFDWLASNVTKVFTKFVDFLHKYGLTDVVAHADKSYYDPGKKELVFNVDVPTHSSIPKAIFTILLLFVPFIGPLLLLVLWLKGVYSTAEKPTLHAYIEPRNVVDGKPLPVAVTFTLSDKTKVTAPAGGVATVGLPEDSTLTIISAEGDSWTLGKDAEDIVWKTKAIIPGATLVIDMHLADLSTKFSVPVQFEDGTPVEGAWVHIRHPDREEARVAAGTDEEGLAWFENIERLKWVVAVAKAKEDLTYYDDGIIDLTVDPYVIPTLVISSKCVMSKQVTITGTTIPIEGVKVDLVNVATGEVVETKNTDADGYVSFLVPPDPDISYKFREVKEGYDEDEPSETDPFPGDDPYHEHDEHDQTGDICQVSVVPTSVEVATIPDAVVKLYNETFTFGPEPVDPSGGIAIPEVPYGTYKIEVSAKDFEQTEEEKAKEYVVSAECKTNGLCLCEFQPLLKSTLIPGEALGEITVFDPPFSAQEGDEIRVPTTIKNAGAKFGEFRMFLFDDTTDEEIEHEPKLTWKDLDPAELYTETLDTDFWVGAMPDHDWKLRIEVRNEKTPDVADDTKRFTVVLGGPAGHILTLDKIRTLVKGEKYTFRGNLTKESVPVAGEKIEIWEDDVFFNDKLCEGVTDDEGNFAIEWTVTAVEGILGGKNAEMYAHHPASETKTSVQKGILIKKPSELTVTTERYSINTIRPVTVELDYYDEVETEWKPVSGYPTEPAENPSKHVTFVYGSKHRIRSIREYIIRHLRSDWEEFDPLEWDERKLKLGMRGYFVIGKKGEEEEED